MKKNIMMRLASFLLVAVLISTSAISGTYAKYVTSDDGSDFARVAEWGVVIEAKSFGMFTDKYETDDETATFTGEYSVDGEGEDVLAPGTEGEFANIKITGKIILLATLFYPISVADATRNLFKQQKRPLQW